MATIEILQHTVDYWYKSPQYMPKHEQEHVKGMIAEGYNSGQLVDYDNETEAENTGWWKIV